MKEKECVFCTSNETIHEPIQEVFEWVETPGVDLIGNELYVTTYLEGITYCITCGPEYLLKELGSGIKINYCPMCGKPL